MAIVAAAVGWLIGLWQAPGLATMLPGPAALLLGAVVGLGAVWRSNAVARLSAIVLVAGLLGIARGQIEDGPAAGPGSIAHWADLGAIEVRGIVVAEPEPGGGGTRLRIAAEEAAGRGGAGTTFGQLQAIVAGHDWRYGDRVAVTGRLERPVDRDDAPLGELYGREGVLATTRATSASVIGRSTLADLWPARPSLAGRADAVSAVAWGTLFDLKADAGAALERQLPADAAALARGLLLGGSSTMATDLVEAFRRSGMTHIVAVSGYNVTLVVAALVPLTRLAAGRRGSLGLAAVGVIVFVLAVGAPVSAVRAAIMGCLVLLARWVGRPADPVAALAAAAIGMTAIEPGVLRDLGFQLSSLATLALVTIYPWLDTRLPGGQAASPRGGSAETTALVGSGGPAVRAGRAGTVVGAGPGVLGWLGGGLRETLLATVAVELLTVPLVAVVFGRVPLLSPLANLLALPAVPVAMLTSLPVVASGLLPDWLAAPFAWVAWVPLAWIIAVVEACAAPSWAAIPLGRLSATLAWAYYTAAAALLLSAHAVSYRAAAPSPVALFRRAIGRVPAPFALGAALLGATVAWAGAFATSDGAARLTFFEGSGATLVQTGGGRVVVIDPGQSGRALAADLGRALSFYVRAIDLVILPRAGEAAAVPELLRRYQVGQIAAPTGEVGGSAREERWGIAAAEARVTVLAPPDGTRVALDEVTSLELIRAEETGAYAVRVAGPHGRVLLLGDGAMSAQRALADRLDGGADVLRLGPETAGALDGVLRERLDPRVAIVHVRSPTVGLAPRPLPRTDERMQVLRGDEHGTIELTLRSTGLQLRSRR